MIISTKITVDHCWESAQVAGRVPRTTALTLGVEKYNDFLIGFGDVKMISIEYKVP